MAYFLRPFLTATDFALSATNDKSGDFH